MKKQFLDSGKIVGTHGIKGEVRIDPWCDSPEFLCAFKKLWLDENGTEFIEVKSRPHKNIALAKITLTQSRQPKNTEARLIYTTLPLYFSAASIVSTPLIFARAIFLCGRDFTSMNSVPFSSSHSFLKAQRNSGESHHGSILTSPFMPCVPTIFPESRNCFFIITSNFTK